MKINWKEILSQVTGKVIMISFLFITSLSIFAFIAQEAVREHEDTFDRSVTSFLTGHLTPGIIRVMSDVTFFGSSMFLLPAYVILAGYCLFTKKFHDAIDIAIISLSSTAMSHALKRIFHRQRPHMPIIKGITTYSFPSGHALSSFIFCSVLMYMVWKSKISTAWKFVLITLLAFCTLAIGVSRIVLNVHYATDVIAGFCLGIMWVILSFYLLKKLRVHHYFVQRNR